MIPLNLVKVRLSPLNAYVLQANADKVGQGYREVEPPYSKVDPTLGMVSKVNHSFNSIVDFDLVGSLSPSILRILSLVHFDLLF